MCRNIRPLFNYEPPTTRDQVHDAALQYVRKVSGYHHPSQANQAAFDRAVKKVTAATEALLDALVTEAPPRDREAEVAKAREKNVERFGTARASGTREAATTAAAPPALRHPTRIGRGS